MMPNSLTVENALVSVTMTPAAISTVVMIITRPVWPIATRNASSTSRPMERSSR